MRTFRQAARRSLQRRLIAAIWEVQRHGQGLPRDTEGRRVGREGRMAAQDEDHGKVVGSWQAATLQCAYGVKAYGDSVRILPSSLNPRPPMQSPWAGGARRQANWGGCATAWGHCREKRQGMRPCKRAGPLPAAVQRTNTSRAAYIAPAKLPGGYYTRLQACFSLERA